MRVHRPARRQRASTRTWPPGAVAWSELVIWRCSLVFRLVIAAMTLHHHTGDVVSTDSSPKDAFLLSRLTIRVCILMNNLRLAYVRPPLRKFCDAHVFGVNTYVRLYWAFVPAKGTARR